MLDKIKLFGIIFIIIFLLYFIFVICNKKQMSKFEKNTYIRYLVGVFKLDVKKLNMKKMAYIVSLSNAFIISLTFVITEITKNFTLKILIGFASLILLEVGIYYIIGKILKGRD